MPVERWELEEIKDDVYHLSGKIHDTETLLQSIAESVEKLIKELSAQEKAK